MTILAVAFALYQSRAAFKLKQQQGETWTALQNAEHERRMAEEHRDQSERRLAENCLDQALVLCDQNEINQGLLLMIAPETQ